MTKKEKSVYNIQSVGHAFDLLEQFNGDVDELGFTELCRRLNFPKNKVFRLLATLESRNFIELNQATAGYRLGLKTLQMGQTFTRQLGLLRQARPILESLSKKSEETSYVAILKDYKAVYLDAIESEQPVRVVSRVGKMFPFYCTDVGKVIAASMDEKNLREYLKHTELKRFTTHTISDLDEMVKQLNKIAKLGYAVDNEERDIGVKCLGAPIRDYTKKVIGAVGISGPSVRFNSKRLKSELIPLLKEATDELSLRLGYC